MVMFSPDRECGGTKVCAHRVGRKLVVDCHLKAIKKPTLRLFPLLFSVKYVVQYLHL